MINSISLKDVATFDQEGVQINDLKKINFVYGSNGSGKTTISNFIHNPEDRKFSSCELNWEGNLPITALVYNKEFRERNFGQENIDGVFTLGEATKEEIEEIEKKEEALKQITLDGKVKSKKKEDLENQKKEEVERFRESAWKLYYKKYEEHFKEAFRGFISKKMFYDKLLKGSKDNTSEQKTLEDLQRRAKTIFGEPPIELVKLDTINFERIVEIESDNVWVKKIVGKSDVNIAKLIQRLNINDWVNLGRGYLQENETCPFCQQDTITIDFREQLEGYFDEEYTTALADINAFQEEYEPLSFNLLNQLNGIETNEKENKTSKLKIDEYSALLKTLQSQITTNTERIVSKQKEPSREIKLIQLDDQLTKIQGLLNEANTEIEAHNKIVTNFNIEKRTLVSEVWRFIAEEAKTELEPHSKKVNGLSKGIDSVSEDLEKSRKVYKTLRKEIVELSKNVTSVQPTVDEINRTLESYGFTNFLIVPSEADANMYQIQRENGERAESTLSEGEITFITFLYFLQRAKGGLTQDTVNDERILVVDDPISSLDSNVLFVVSSLIKEIIKDIKDGRGNIRQLLLLTHNVYFHKEVSFIDGRTKKSNNTNYWMLRKRNKISTIQPFIMDNPISTSYELLWKELIERDKNSGIAIQNIMRRIIENYFKILGKYGDDELILKFDNREDQEVCRSLICWINDGSHS